MKSMKRGMKGHEGSNGNGKLIEKRQQHLNVLSLGVEITPPTRHASMSGCGD